MQTTKNLRVIGVPTVRKVTSHIVPMRANTMLVREKVYETVAPRPKQMPRSPREMMPDDTVRRIIRKAHANPDHKLYWSKYSIVDWPYTNWGTLGCVLEDVKTGKRELWTVSFKTHEPKYLCPWL